MVYRLYGLLIQAFLSAEILNFNFKHHEAINTLEPVAQVLFELQSSYFQYLFCMASCQRVFLLFVSIIPNSWVLWCYQALHDDLIPFLQDMMNPPIECWFMLDALCYDTFGNLDWMQFFKILFSPKMWGHLSIYNKCSNWLLTFLGFLTLWLLSFGPLQWELNHSFYDLWMPLIKDHHFHQHHIEHILILKWY